MAIRKVARMGHPVLRKVARKLSLDEIKTPAFKQLLADMVETMHEYGGIGLAAPQIHESVSVAIIEYQEGESRYEDENKDDEDSAHISTEKSTNDKPEKHKDALTEMPLSVFVNATITVLDEKEQGYWEGCLSVPEIRGLVYRPRKIRVDYLDQDGKKKSLIAEGFLATVFQHELDHLAGTLFVDRIRNEPGKTQIAFTEEYSRYHVPHEDSDVGELAD